MFSTLSTSRLLLRPFERSDREAVAAYRRDEKVVYYITGSPETDEEITQFLKRTRTYAQQQPQTQYRFAVVLTSNEQVIGGCGLDNTDRDSREAEIGYHLHRGFWGQGIGTEVAKELLRFGFEDLTLHRLFADCAADNTASANVVKKAGMRHEGHFRANKRIGERWHDTLLYAILDGEWHAQQIR